MRIYSLNQFLSIGLLLVLFLVIPTESVKSYLFKKCDESSFCHRNRFFANSIKSLGDSNYKPIYKIDPDSFDIDIIRSSFKGDIIKTLNDGQTEVVLPFEVNILKDNNIRLRIDELNRINGKIQVDNNRLTKRRFNEAYKYAFKDNGNVELLDKDVELKFEKFDDRLELTYGKNLENCLKIFYYPFKLVTYLDDKEVAVINDRNFLNVEHWRQRQENDTLNLSPEETDFNLFHDSFKDSKNDKLPFGPESIGLDVSLLQIDTVFGLAEHSSMNLQLKDTSETDPYRLFNVDIFEYETESQFPMYGSIPFIMGVREDYSVGVFWVNGADTWVDVNKIYDGDDVNEQRQQQQQQVLSSKKEKKTSTHWMSENGIIDLVIMVGKTPSEVNSKYGLVTGFTKLPALFSLGYHQCRWNYNDEEDVLNVHQNFDIYNISYDTIWLDVEYTDSKRYFTWKDQLFSDPIGMVNTLDETGRNLVVIIDPHIKADYFLSEEIEKRGIGIANSDNEKCYHGHCWPGESVWIDTFNPKAREYWITLFKNSTTGNNFIGSASNIHIWNDMSEPSIFNGPETSAPKDLVHYGGWEHRSIHNIYGLTFHEATYEALQLRFANENKRPFILTRSFYSGSQRTVAMWTGDNRSKWEFLKLSIPMNLNQGIVNFPFSGSDVGGFFGNPSKDLLTRWYQTGIFYPFFRAHAHIDSRRREPWLIGEPYTSIIRDLIDLRYKLLPVLYTAFYENSINGLPIMKPVFYEHPENPETYSIDDEFFLSDSGLLAKPIVEENCVQTDIYFPDDEIYYNFFDYSDHIQDGPKRYTIDKVSLETLPLFIKGGNILTTKERHRRSTRLMKYDPYTLTVALDKENNFAKGKLYIDDGETFNHESSNDYLIAQFEYSNNQLKSSIFTKDNSNQPLVQSLNTIKIEKIKIIGSKLKYKSKKAKVSQDGKEWEVDLIDNSDHYVVRNPGVVVGKQWIITPVV
ncbi:hypothetical protein PACTADRAFT_47860 [Pachysolen tannophilus NRRL Y-2460]|uniref:Glucosidase II subunit alpha n=1 Tax=Pachysolen tannophilus NRRL Y-2460 TaxID=669874 RepID=A0A1E4U2A5_PACTA|nr:hypothetical protein PACTADRAFT_47860 [Pachysolen tannophilus NRRL Y-2460]